MKDASSSASVTPIIVMGVTGSGKSLIGSMLSARLERIFIDADDLHPIANVAKMSSGTPLTDDDRWPWLDAVAETISNHNGESVTACSALRRRYRDRIRRLVPGAYFIELNGPQALLSARISSRAPHFMPPSLLASQIQTLESLQADEAGLIVRADVDPEALLRRILAEL